jgi:uncharacterized protein (UPF0332 family)
MDPRAFNQVAIDIIVRRPPTGPAAYRSAISRAYYAAFHVAADALAGIGHSPGSGDGSHKKVVIYLQQSGDEGLDSAAKTIDQMRTMRNHADYDMKNLDVEELSNVRRTAEMAQQAIDHLDVFVKDAERKNAAAEAIARYKVKIHMK